MYSVQTEHLVHLIQSMTKAEKRAFRLYVNRDHHGQEKLFVKLFDYIEKHQKYDEKEILVKYKTIKKSQLSNIKSHLSHQLLVILRKLHSDKHIDITVREYTDFARILQDKGLIMASLDILEKAKKLAETHQDTMLKYLVNAEIRKIESNYITGTSTQRATLLNEESKELTTKIGLLDSLSNLSHLLYGMYLKYGYIKDQKDHEFIKDFFLSHLPKIDVDQIGLYEKIYYFQSHVWYHHITLDFAQYYKYSQKWVDCFHETPLMIKENVILYFRGLHNALNALYLANKSEKFQQHYEHFIKFCENNFDHLTHNEQGHFILFKHIHMLNMIFLSGQYSHGVKQLPELIADIESNVYGWDSNRIMIFYYKIACVFFGNDDFDNAILFLDKIVANPYANLRLDVQSFARFLLLISHYELGNEYLLPYQIRSVYRFLIKIEQLQFVQREILNFIKRTPQMDRKTIKTEFINLRATLFIAQQDKYLKQPFLFLDIIAWLDSKIEGKPIQEIIRRNIVSI